MKHGEDQRLSVGPIRENYKKILVKQSKDQLTHRERRSNPPWQTQGLLRSGTEYTQSYSLAVLSQIVKFDCILNIPSKNCFENCVKYRI